MLWQVRVKVKVRVRVRVRVRIRVRVRVWIWVRVRVRVRIRVWVKGRVKGRVRVRVSVRVRVKNHAVSLTLYPSLQHNPACRSPRHSVRPKTAPRRKNIYMPGWGQRGPTQTATPTAAVRG